MQRERKYFVDALKNKALQDCSFIYLRWQNDTHEVTCWMSQIMKQQSKSLLSHFTNRWKSHFYERYLISTWLYFAPCFILAHARVSRSDPSRYSGTIFRIAAARALPPYSPTWPLCLKIYYQCFSLFKSAAFLQKQLSSSVVKALALHSWVPGLIAGEQTPSTNCPEWQPPLLEGEEPLNIWIPIINNLMRVVTCWT